MDTEQHIDLLSLLKTLADDSRLMMVSLMSGQERTVTEMSGLLKLSEPTVSHHVSRMHSAGLLRLRMAGNQRFYQINPTRLAKFKSYVASIEAPLEKPLEEESDNAWIDALDWDREDKKVLYDYTFNGRLTQLPSKVKKWLVVLRWLVTKFEPSAHYTEKQINAILTDYHEDYATIRRYLVDFGYLRRERGGGDYWLTPENERVERDALP